jgi:hypothetical protein
MPCRSCVNRRFGGTCLLHLQGRKIRERGTSLSRWLVDGILHSRLCENLKSYLVDHLHDIHNYARQHLKLACDRMEARYDRLANFAGYHENDKVL